MTSPVRADSYLPVDPDTDTVHDYVSGRTNATRCGRSIPWVKNIMLITDAYTWCPDCYPEES